MVRQSSFFLMGSADGLNEVRSTTTEGLRRSLPGLRGHLDVDEAGRWLHKERPEAANAALIEFLNGLAPISQGAVSQ